MGTMTIVHVAARSKCENEGRILFKTSKKTEPRVPGSLELGGTLMAGVAFIDSFLSKPQTIVDKDQFLPVLMRDQQGSQNIESALGRDLEFDARILHSCKDRFGLPGKP
jgi:hypothetical protein